MAGVTWYWWLRPLAHGTPGPASLTTTLGSLPPSTWPRGTLALDPAGRAGPERGFRRAEPPRPDAAPEQDESTVLSHIKLLLSNSLALADIPVPYQASDKETLQVALCALFCPCEDRESLNDAHGSAHRALRGPKVWGEVLSSRVMWGAK